MSRRRCFVEGCSHHVYARGNNRCDIFRDPDDHLLYVLLMRRASLKYDVAVHAEIQMTTHVHLLVTPATDMSLPRMMQSVLSNYTVYFNGKYRRTGTLWEGRYRSNVIVSERYWYTCMRYIELNPVRASIVSSPGDYSWSSYHANALRRPRPDLTPHPLYVALGKTATERCEQWRMHCGEGVANDDLSTIREALFRGWTIERCDESPDPRSGVISSP